MRKRLSGLLCLLAFHFCTHAQTATQSEVTGSVSGHVFCSDTNQPARFATVLLQPPPHKLAPNEQPTASPTERTALDGSFHFPKVKPGTYYLLAEYAGYISPLAKVPPVDENNQASVEKLEKLLDKVTVAANKDTTADIELERGAAIAGTVHFDDGSPANSVQINLFRQQEDGKLAPVSTRFGGAMGLISPQTAMQTDDNGSFRIAGLPAGKYVVGIISPTISIGYGGLLGGPKLVSVSTNESAALSVYSGNVFRQKDAKPVELVAGDERTGADVTIPLLGLHTIGGSVIALSDNHAINQAHIELLYADDKTTLRAITLDEDGRFSFSYIPEGEYILRINDAADTVKETRHDGQMSYEVDKPMHYYASVDQSLILHDDVSSLVVNVPEKSVAKKQ